MNYDPIKVAGETFEHLRQKPMGHVKVSLLMFVGLQVIVWGMVCFGMFGMVGGLVATEGNEKAQVVMMLMFYVAIFGMAFVLVPPLLFYYYGYQKATLDEIDGKGEVGPGAVFGNIGALLVPISGLMLVQCGAGFVGLLMCYVGAFFTTIPLRYAFFLKVDREISVMDAIALAWEGFWGNPWDHAKAMGTVMVLSMVLSYIPLVGPMILWPVLAVFEAKTYRAIYGPPASAALPVPG